MALNIRIAVMISVSMAPERKAATGLKEKATMTQAIASEPKRTARPTQSVAISRIFSIASECV